MPIDLWSIPVSPTADVPGTVIRSNPNPQGKGLTPILSDWQQFTPHPPCAKSESRLLADYFTSMLVLSAEFHFKPVIGQRYYLYLLRDHWQLSLVEPHRWTSSDNNRDCLGCCELHSDMTWSVQPLPETELSDELLLALQAFALRLQAYLSENKGGDWLPFFERQLPYYRRLAASGLARSLRCASATSLAQVRSRLISQSPTALLASTSTVND